jgi:DNA invertase Pin-like site-specific DNA recombinase
MLHYVAIGPLSSSGTRPEPRHGGLWGLSGAGRLLDSPGAHDALYGAPTRMRPAAPRALKRAALYVRVSTDAQTVENQIRELRQVAGRRGWDVVEVYSDAGISGAKGRNGRPGLDSMLKNASRRKFDIVMAWAIDRLGRSLSDLLDTIQHLEACDVDLYLDQQAIDTTTPMGKLVFQVTGAFAEFERTMIRQRIKAGLKRAVAQGVKLGRPNIDSATERNVRRQLAKGVGILKLAKSLGIGTGTVQRIANELR